MARGKGQSYAKNRREGESEPVGFCDTTGMPMYRTRKGCKTAAKRLPARVEGAEGHLTAFSCPDCRYWHFGHLDPDVAAGNVSRDVRYAHPDHTEALSA